MLKTSIENRDGETLELDLSESKTFLQIKLRNFQKGTRMGSLPLKGTQSLQVKVYSDDDDLGEGLVKLLTESDTLEDAWQLEYALTNAREEIKPELEDNLLNEQYQTKEDLYEDIQKLSLSLAPYTLTFYCPLSGGLSESAAKDRFSSVDNAFLLSERETIAQALRKEQGPDSDLTERVQSETDLDEKLVHIEWGVEEKNGRLYGRIDCHLKEPLTEAETMLLREGIEDQNSNGFGEIFDAHAIRTEAGYLYISFWLNGDDDFLYTEEEMSKYLTVHQETQKVKGGETGEVKLTIN